MKKNNTSDCKIYRQGFTKTGTAKYPQTQSNILHMTHGGKMLDTLGMIMLSPPFHENLVATVCQTPPPAMWKSGSERSGHAGCLAWRLTRRTSGTHRPLWVILGQTTWHFSNERLNKDAAGDMGRRGGSLWCWGPSLLLCCSMMS